MLIDIMLILIVIYVSFECVMISLWTWVSCQFLSIMCMCSILPGNILIESFICCTCLGQVNNVQTSIGAVDMTINAILMFDILLSFRLSYLGDSSFL